MADILERFSPATAAWFAGAFAAPTAAQAGAWEAVSAGQSALVVAPTGSGKTLAAFLWSLDRLAAGPAAGADRRCRVLYVSPLKALAADVERNLRSPLAGIRQAAHRLGLPQPDVRVAMRTGDTPAEERRSFTRRPPDILITTPESLFLILTSQAREALRGVETVIVDEVHAVCATKRGAHLALSLERLDALLDRPAQRVGLSATVRPVPEVAQFLGGSRPVTVVQPAASKTLDLHVVGPVADMTALAEEPETERRSIWPAVEERVLEVIRRHRSTIVFANSRRTAERLTSRLNELAYKELDHDELGHDELGHDEDAGQDGRDDPAGRTDPPPDPNGRPGGRTPAEKMGQGGTAPATPAEVARAHHGSVSREQRQQIEEALKAGRLPAVVATSSLELGIDMGAVDMVVQVEAPPSVASGLQRIGRAGHQVGAVSQGVILPKYRGDLVQCAVVAERMAAGAIEELHYPRNPLDVLAQHVVAMVAVEPWRVGELGRLVRRAAPFAGLPESALDAVLDMLSGRYPSDAFAELRPRLTWDRVTDTLTARPGAQRLAVTSGGTIPDRGLFGVFMAAGPGETGSRVGELDEEMVYESRVGDVFLLGSSSWRIEEISHDRVLVSPAPGQPGRMPYWHGDAPGRPLELGRALGRFLREMVRLDDDAAVERVRRVGLDEWAAANLVGYLRDQKEATGHLPDDHTVLVERFRDELGDWRLCVHSPFGAQVNSPWALAMGARVRERYGVDVQTMHSDDGIVLRLPETESDPPPAELAVFDPDEVEALVTAEVGGSALFASRFRECAARALLLPRRNPGKRTPLWQQRQRAAQLLQVASDYGSFPVVLETMRECLQDVFDLPGLTEIMRAVAGRRVRLVEVETQTPSPFARSLLFGYVGAFMYDGDAPLAERRAQALSLDSTLLAELLGQAELRELIDADSLAEVERELQRLTEGRRAASVEGTADLLRIVGDLTTAEAIDRGATPAWLAALEEDRRAIRVRIAGEERWVAIEDAGRVRDALGVPLPVGVPEAFTEPVRDPLGDLVSRYARTHGPFVAADCAARLGLGPAVVTDTLRRLSASGRLMSGEFRPGGTGVEWCDAEVLRLLRRRSLARLRHEVEPVSTATLARFLPAWQHVGRSSGRGTDTLLQVVEQLQGCLMPASALERLVLPARVVDYAPTMLDELSAAGEIVWAGSGALPGNDGWVTLALADSADLLLPPVDPDATLTPLHQAVLDALDAGQALFFRTLADRVRSSDDTALTAAVWDLVWAGWLTNDTLAPLRALLGTGRTAHSARKRPPRVRYGRPGRPPLPSRTGPPSVAGRWWRLPGRETDPTRRAHALAETLLDRYGVVTKGAVAAEHPPGGFAGVYPVFKALEEAGRIRRGYFVEGLGAAQFAAPAAVDRMRALGQPRTAPAPAWTPPVPGGWQPHTEPPPAAVVLAATDPANPYGAALPWPPPTGRDENARGDEAAGRRAGHQPGRKAGALVVLLEGDLVLYVERGGRTLLSFTDDPAALQPAVDALALAVRDGWLGKLAVERADGGQILDSPIGQALEAAGFRPTPRGLRLRG